MEQKNIRRNCLWGFLFTAVAGVLLHFVYEWFGGWFWAVLGAVNESVWEHLKLLFWPAFLFCVGEWILTRHQHPYPWKFAAQSILLGMALIVVPFYTYSGILGFTVTPVDIGLFFLGTAGCWGYFFRKRSKALASPSEDSQENSRIYLILLLLIAALFVIFTFYPPKIALFQDPLTGMYGIKL